MSIWAISDLHLYFSSPDKNMNIFGEEWENHAEKIETTWKSRVAKDDLVLIPGDISWAMKFENALIDLKWIDSLPGTKLLIKGNHDYWYASISKMTPSLPSSIIILHNDAYHYNDIAIGGTRLWDCKEFNFNEYIDIKENAHMHEEKISSEQSERIYQRELLRLEESLKQMHKSAKFRIAMTHYPPVSADLKDSEASKILEKYHINVCVFGHLHSLKKNSHLFGEKNNIQYLLTSCEYINFTPIKII